MIKEIWVHADVTTGQALNQGCYTAYYAARSLGVSTRFCQISKNLTRLNYVKISGCNFPNNRIINPEKQCASFSCGEPSSPEVSVNTPSKFCFQ